MTPSCFLVMTKMAYGKLARTSTWKKKTRGNVSRLNIHSLSYHYQRRKSTVELKDVFLHHPQRHSCCFFCSYLFFLSLICQEACFLSIFNTLELCFFGVCAWIIQQLFWLLHHCVLWLISGSPAPISIFFIAFTIKILWKRLFPDFWGSFLSILTLVW